MRHRKADLLAPVKADLHLRYEAKELTSFAGLELVRRYFHTIGLAQRIRRHLAGMGLDGDYSSVQMIHLVLAFLIVGGKRLHQLLFHRDDPMILRLCGLKHLPSAETVRNWLRRFTSKKLDRLLRVNDEVVAEAIRESKLGRLTIDVDGSVVSTGMQADWAFRGYNPHHRKVPSYFPITAYEAQTGQILRTRNRPGNVHDGKAGVGFLKEIFAQIDRTLGKDYLLEFRMDGAFFREDVVKLLESRGAEYAIKVPFYTWVGLKEEICKRKRWKRNDAHVSHFSTVLYLEPWDMDLRVVIYRKKVGHKTRKNYQLDLFDPSNGTYEYSAVVTNKSLNGKNLWFFMNGRGSHEKAYAELKDGFAYDCVPTNHYGANSAWQILNVLAFNLMKSFQVATTASQRSRSRKRRTVFSLHAINTLRFQWINRAASLTAPQGYRTLDVGNNPVTRQRYQSMDRRLRAA